MYGTWCNAQFITKKLTVKMGNNGRQQWEEAQTQSRVMMVIRLYNGEELLSHTPWKCQILQPQKERVRMIRTEMHASSP